MQTGIMSMQDFSCKYPMLNRAFQCLYQHTKDSGNYKKNYSGFLQSKSLSSVLKELDTVASKDLLVLFQIAAETKKRMVPGVSEASSEVNDLYPHCNEQIWNKWEIRKTTCMAMLRDGRMRSDYPQQVMGFLQQYIFIRNERNQINHANEEDQVTPDEIRKMVRFCIRQLRAVRT